jgi:hypothetical protein
MPIPVIGSGRNELAAPRLQHDIHKFPLSLGIDMAFQANPCRPEVRLDCGPDSLADVHKGDLYHLCQYGCPHDDECAQVHFQKRGYELTALLRVYPCVTMGPFLLGHTSISTQRPLRSARTWV